MGRTASSWQWTAGDGGEIILSPAQRLVGLIDVRAIIGIFCSREEHMGSIRFSAASMFGSLSDVVGTKSGLALNRQQLCDLLGRDERFRKFQRLGDDDWVRIH